MLSVRFLAACAVALLVPRLALAQQALPGIKTSKQARIDRLSDNHWRLTGEVEIEDRDMRFFADVLDYYLDEHRIEASGNVVVVTKDSRIAADRAEFDTQKRTGVFHNASGTASLGDRVDKSMFGTQEPDAYFYGETVEKLAYKKYRITKGGFTTCVQPTPRWEVVSSQATITLEKYAVVKNAILKVKDVPMFYMPIFYYPVQEDDRATGFLIPMYGASTIRGSSLSNAFFWAINRSSDATFFHDWFTRTGQGVGGEYRYITEPGSEGYVKTYWLNEHEATYTSSTGTETTTPARRSYELRGTAVQRLPGHLRARGNIDYFSDVTVQQTYNSNLYDASRRQRSFGGNVAGSWGPSSVSFTYNRAEVFYNEDESTLNGSTPRILYSRGATKLGSLPVYFSANADYAQILRTSRTATTEVVQGLSRLDTAPTIRAPLAHLSWFSVNSSLTWRNTWWSESLGPNGERLKEGVYRGFLDMRADATGPTFTRIFDTPGNGYAERFKHVIEPTFGISRTTLFDNYDQIVKLDGVDYLVGGTTQMTYGLTNRLLAKLRSTRQAREFVTVSIFQSYYTDARASQYDPSFGTSFSGREPSNFSPIQLTARTMPTEGINGLVRLEYDHEKGEVTTFRAGGGYSTTEALQVLAGWSRRKISDTQTDNYIDAATNIKIQQGRWGGTYNLSYDFFRDRLVTQRITAYHHAQCCGVAIEFQKFAFPVFNPSYPVASDRRFNISFTLAGVGSFSNFFGALTGTGGSQRSF